jgi:hypothetical protein
MTGMTMAARIMMTAMTTRSSMRVKARVRGKVCQPSLHGWKPAQKCQP